MNHRLQLFDSAETLGESVAAFLLEGYHAGDNLLIIAKPRHRDAVLAALHQSGCFPPEVETRQRLIALDAADVLQHITRHGELDPVLFQRTLKPLIQTLTGAGALRIYGEVVELLAEEEDLAGATALEEMWNALAGEVNFTLMCGYSSAHFAQSHTMRWLRRICGTHSHTAASVDDPLATYLLATA